MIMPKDIFYHYSFYVLEQKYDENKFIKILENESLLNSKIESFIQNVIDLLFTTITKSESIKAPSIAIPEIEKDLGDILKNIPIYDIYFESNPENILSEVVINKFLSRIFRKDGFNGETYIIQNYIHSWLEKRLALGICNDSRFKSVDILKSLIEKTEMLNNFYAYLVENIPFDWVLDNKKDWVGVSAKPENIMDSIRTFDKEYFNYYTDLLDSSDKTNLWEYIHNVTNGSNYAMLTDEYSFISAVLIKNAPLLWIEFWDNLKFPIIQDCVFPSFLNFSPQQYLVIVNALVNQKVNLKSNLDELLLIVSKNYFEASYKLTERLLFYEVEDGVKKENKHFFEEGQKYYKQWLEEKQNNYKKLIEDLQTRLQNTDIENWIFSYKPKINNSHIHKPNEIYNYEIELLTSVYKSYGKQSINFNLQSFNLQKFNFHVKIVKDSDDKYLSPNLLETMINFIESDKFYWDKTFSEPYWSSMKGIAYLISLNPDPIEKSYELIEKFTINHQGWKPVKSGYKLLIKESFVYSSVALLFEHNNAFKDDTHKEHFFKELSNIILIQNRYSQNGNYQESLNLLFLVTNQVFFAVKEYFEITLIRNYDNLYSLLCILSSDEKSICNKSQKLIAERLEKEFIIEKKQLNNRSQKNKVLEMEKMIETLKID